MARAIAECTCATCGAKFEKIAFKYNRTEADEWKAWAEENCTTCPDCWTKEKQEKDAMKAAELIAELHLPEIAGKSEKQIKYANDLRNKAVLDATVRPNLEKIVKLLNSDKYKAIAAENGTTVEEAVGNMMQSRWKHPQLLKIVTSGDARIIIDTIKDYYYNL